MMKNHTLREKNDCLEGFNQKLISDELNLVKVKIYGIFSPCIHAS